MNKTLIFNSYDDFLNREDKDINGVDKAFVDAHPNYEKDNETNKACWSCYDCSYCSHCYDCSDCYDCSYCSRCYDCSYCSRCYDCSDCSDCYDCSYCSRCSDCSDCSRCYDCSDCSRCYDLKKVKRGDQSFTIPVIENIHQKVYEAASEPNALNMREWHTCSTTHCRGGWVEFLAGDAANKLAEETSTLFAAMMIYKESSPIKVSPVRFFEDNEIAMADMKRCADEEKAL